MNPKLDKDKNIVDWDWEGAEGAAVETEQTSITDPKSGKQIVMRVFDFDLPPIPPEQFPSKEELLAQHKAKIMGFLWRDELVPVHDMKVIFSKDKRHFRIFSACQAKANSVILEKSERLDTYLYGNKDAN